MQSGSVDHAKLRRFLKKALPGFRENRHPVPDNRDRPPSGKGSIQPSADDRRNSNRIFADGSAIPRDPAVGRIQPFLFDKTRRSSVSSTVPLAWAGSICEHSVAVSAVICVGLYGSFLPAGYRMGLDASNARCAPRHGHPDSGRDPITFYLNSPKNHKNTRRIQPTAGSASWPDQSVKILLLSAYSSSCCTDLHGSKRLSRGEFNREVRGCMSGGLRASPPTGPG